MRTAEHDSWTVTLIRLIVSASLAVMSLSVMAERAPVWSREYVVSVPFNEKTSKSSARSLALDRARSLAANEFGSGVFTEEELKDGVLKEKTRVVTAGVTRMKVASESYQQNGDGLVSGEFRIEVEISQDELERQFEALRRDASRDQRLRTLQRENELLEARLKSKDGAGVAEAIALRDLLNNSPRTSSADVVFPRGALVSVAVHSDQSQSVWDRIEDGLFTPLRSAEYKVTLAGAELDGEEVKVKLQVQWNLDLSFMRAKSLGYAPTYTKLPDAQYAEGFCIQPRAEPAQVFRDLMEEAVWLEIQIGSRSERFMIGGAIDSQWCVANGSMGAGKPIEVRLPVKDAAAAGEIKSRLVRGKPEAGQRVSSLSRELMRSYFYRR